MAVEYTAKQIANSNSSVVVFHLIRLINYDGAGNNLYFCDLDEDYTHTDSNTYKAIPLQIGEITQGDDGKLNDIPLAVGNVDRAIEYYILQYELSGKEVAIETVYQIGENKSSQIFTFNIKGIKANEDVATFTLGIGFDILKQTLPRRKVFANHCMWRFKSSECGYSGSATTCDKTYNGCKIKPNFGGFPSIQGTMIWI